MYVFFYFGVAIIILAIMAIALGYTIICNIGAVLFTIGSVIAFFAGAYLFFCGFGKKTILQKIAACLRGLMLATIFIYILLLVDFASYGGNFSKGSYVLIGHFDFLQKDMFFTSLFICLILLGVLIIPVQIRKNVGDKKTGAVLDIFSILLVAAIYIGAFQITMKDYVNNNIGFFNMNNPKYEVMQNVDIRNEDLYFIKTGNFKVGTKLYGSDFRTEYEGTEYVEVTDGKKMGYVREADLKTLY